MITITNALVTFNVSNWVLRGEPTTETEFNQMFRKITGFDVNGTEIESDDPATFGVTWVEVKAKYDELVAGEPLKLLREKRNALIAKTDWWANSDLTMTAEQTAYRQALRDITNTYTSLDTVVWPTKP